MARYRKKPVEIEAIPVAEVLSHIFGNAVPWPDWAQEALDSGQISLHADRGDQVEIVTMEGAMLGSTGDWLIRGVKGELYPCKPDIFESTYTPVDLPDTPEEAWRGEPPAEGTRRWHILQAIEAYEGRLLQLDDLQPLELADEIEGALLSAAAQPETTESGATREAIATVSRALDELGTSWRNDWNDFDGRTLRVQLETATALIDRALKGEDVLDEAKELLDPEEGFVFNREFD